MLDTEPPPTRASKQPHLPSRASPRATSYRKPTWIAPGLHDLDWEELQGLPGP